MYPLSSRVREMTRVIRVRYENGVLKPLEKLDLREGEELEIIIAGRSFYDLVEELELEAREDVDRVVGEVRGRGGNLYS